jgi:hypothetical protein
MRGNDVNTEVENVICGGVDVNPLSAEMWIQSSRKWSRKPVLYIWR